MVYQAINIPNSGKSYLNNVKQILNKDGVVRVIHIFRDANKIADALANLNFSRNIDTLMYDSCLRKVSYMPCLICLEKFHPESFVCSVVVLLKRILKF